MGHFRLLILNFLFILLLFLFSFFLFFIYESSNKIIIMSQSPTTMTNFILFIYIVQFHSSTIEADCQNVWGRSVINFFSFEDKGRVRVRGRVRGYG